LLIVIGDLSHLNQFVIHGFFKELSESASVSLAIPESEMSSQRWTELSKIFDGSITEVIPYLYSARARTAGYQLGAALTYRHRKRSESYKVKILESLFQNFDLPIEKFSRLSCRLLFKNRRALIGRVIHELPAMVRGTRTLFWIWSKLVSRKISTGCDIQRVIETCEPQVVILLMQRQAGFVIASVSAAEKLQVPTVLIPHKWDNASSKSPLLTKPTRLLVFNCAIKEVCTCLHLMPPHAVVAVGAVEISQGKFVTNDHPENLILLTGASGDTRKSERWLKIVDDVVLKYFEFSSFEVPGIIWRPYPTYEKKNLDFMREFVAIHPRIELDSDIVHGVSHRNTNLSFPETLDAYERYTSLLESALFVVSEGTSVIVDARARGLAVIYPAFKKDAVVGSQWHRLNTSNHLKGLRETTGVFIAEDEQELERLLVDFLTNPRRIPPDNSGENIFVDERSYARRVLDVVDEVVAEKAMKAG
jgi:hypothetical protein